MLICRYVVNCHLEPNKHIYCMSTDSIPRNVPSRVSCNPGLHSQLPSRLLCTRNEITFPTRAWQLDIAPAASTMNYHNYLKCVGNCSST